LLESGAVVGLALLERSILEAEEVLIAKILDERYLASGVIVKDVRDV
jgi:hypothetical protein